MRNIPSSVALALIALVLTPASAFAEPACLDLEQLQRESNREVREGRHGENMIMHTIDIQVTPDAGNMGASGAFLDMLKREIYLNLFSPYEMDRNRILREQGYDPVATGPQMTQTGCSKLEVPAMMGVPSIGPMTILDSSPQHITVRMPDMRVPNMGEAEVTFRKTGPKSYRTTRNYRVAIEAACGGMMGGLRLSANVVVTEETVWGRDAAARAADTTRLNTEVLRLVHIPSAGVMTGCSRITNINGQSVVQTSVPIGAQTEGQIGSRQSGPVMGSGAAF